MALLCSLKAFSSEGWNKFGSALLYSLGAESLRPHSSRKPHKRAINHPSFVPGFGLNPVFILPVQAFLSQARDAVSKLPSFRDSRGANPPCSLTGRVSPHFCPRMLENAVARLRSRSEFMSKQSGKPAPLPAGRPQPEGVPFLMPGNSIACWHIQVQSFL